MNILMSILIPEIRQVIDETVQNVGFYRDFTARPIHWRSQRPAWSDWRHEDKQPEVGLCSVRLLGVRELYARS